MRRKVALRDSPSLQSNNSQSLLLEVIGLLVLMFLAFFPALIGLIISWIARKKKWHSKWLMISGGFLVGINFWFGFFFPYVKGTVLLIQSVRVGYLIGPVIDILWMIAPFSLSSGLLFAGITNWILANRPELVGLPRMIQSNMIKIKVKKKTLLNVTPEEQGVVLGINHQQQPVTLTDAEANMHTLVIGATGTGKTNSILVILESAIRRGKTVIVVDGKGDPQFLEAIQLISKSNGREFQSFSYRGTTRYNPLRHGSATELKDKLITMEQWTEPYYKRAAERYLQLVFRVMKLSNKKIDLHSVMDLLTPRKLIEEMKGLSLGQIDREVANQMKEYVNTLDSNHRNAIDGLKDRIALFTESDIGPLLREGSDSHVIDLLDCVTKKRVVFFSLSGISYSSFTPALGAMIVEDLKGVASAISQSGTCDYAYVVLDEFNLFVGTQIVNLITKSRTVGFCCVIATQELADLKLVNGLDLIGQIIGNTNIKIIHRQDVPQSAEYLSKVVGTKKIWDPSYTNPTVSASFSFLRNEMVSIRSQEEEMIHPNTLKSLLQGQAVVIKKVPSPCVHYTQMRSVSSKQK